MHTALASFQSKPRPRRNYFMLVIPHGYPFLVEWPSDSYERGIKRSATLERHELELL